MKKYPIKTYPTVGCCGIDCGLCPRYYTVGSSRCPGCCGPDFHSQHPSCPIVTCCVVKKDLEVCAQCDEFPCPRFEGWDVSDSFVTHKKSISNLDFIKEQGIEEFMKWQKKRIALLETMLKHFDVGKSKGLYCISATLLPITDLEESLEKAARTEFGDIKAKAKSLKTFLNDLAVREGIELRLRNKKSEGDRDG